MLSICKDLRIERERGNPDEPMSLILQGWDWTEKVKGGGYELQEKRERT